MLNSELEKLDRTQLKWQIHLRQKRTSIVLDDLEALPTTGGSPSEQRARETLLSLAQDAVAVGRQMRARLGELENG